MAFRRAPYCSDEELLKELRKLGYNDVAPDVFQMMKEDLSGLIDDEPYTSGITVRPERTLSSSTIIKYSGRDDECEESKGNYHRKLKPQLSLEAKLSADSKISNGSSLKDNLETKEDRYNKYRNRLNAFKMNTYARNEAECESSENTVIDSPRNDSEPSKSLTLARKYVRLQRKYVLSGTLPDIIISRERNSDQKLVNGSTSNSVSEVEDPIRRSEAEDPLRKYRRFFKPRVKKSDILERSKEFSRSFETSLLSSSASLTENKMKTYGKKSSVLEESKELSQPFESSMLSSSAALTENKVKKHGKKSDDFEENESGELSKPFERNLPSSSATLSGSKIKTFHKRSDDLDESETEELSRPFESSRLASSAALPENRMKTYDKKFNDLEESESDGEEPSRPFENSVLSSSGALTESKVKAYGKRSNVLEESEEFSQHSDRTDSSRVSSSATLSESKMKTYGKSSNVLEESEELPRSSDSSLMSSSVALTENKIKRKVLRHKDGKPVITEEFLDIPSVFNTSYPETENLENSKSFSSDDLSWKSNGSTGSVNALSPENHSLVHSSYSTPRSLHLRIANQRKKKSDPVTMYNYYKQYWNNFKPPGEKTHDKLRWAVRDKMLDYNL